MSRSESRRPALRLRMRRGRLVLLLPPVRAAGASRLAFVASWQAPFLRRLVIHHGGRPAPTDPRDPAAPARLLSVRDLRVLPPAA